MLPRHSEWRFKPVSGRSGALVRFIFLLKVLSKVVFSAGVVPAVSRFGALWSARIQDGLKKFSAQELGYRLQDDGGEVPRSEFFSQIKGVGR